MIWNCCVHTTGLVWFCYLTGTTQWITVQHRVPAHQSLAENHLVLERKAELHNKTALILANAWQRYQLISPCTIIRSALILCLFWLICHIRAVRKVRLAGVNHKNMAIDCCLQRGFIEQHQKMGIWYVKTATRKIIFSFFL